MPIKVLHVVGQLEYGGVATWLKTLAKTAGKSELQLEICCNYRRTTGVLRQEFEDLGIPVFHIPLGYNLLAYELKLRKHLHSSKYTVVHDHRSFLAGATLKVSKKTNVPVRILYHHTADDDLMGGFFLRAYWQLIKHWALKSATHIWGCSKAVLNAQYGPRWNEHALSPTVMYGSVPVTAACSGSRQRIRSELGIPQDAKVIGFVARMTRAKNPLLAMEVCKSVLQIRNNTFLIWVGDGPLLSAVQQTLRTTDISARIRITGFRHDIPDLLSALDVFLQPSLWEGLPLGTLEALHSHLPVVGSLAPGLLEALPPAMHSLCSDANDISSHIANILKVLDGGAPQVDTQSFLDTFNPTAFSKRIINAYRNALSEISTPQKH